MPHSASPSGRDHARASKGTGSRPRAGHVLQREGRLEEAKGEFLRSTELEPASGFFWANLGRAAFELVEFDEAERYFRKGLSVELDEPVLCREYGALLKATSIRQPSTLQMFRMRASLELEEEEVPIVAHLFLHSDL